MRAHDRNPWSSLHVEKVGRDGNNFSKQVSSAPNRGGGRGGISAKIESEIATRHRGAQGVSGHAGAGGGGSTG